MELSQLDIMTKAEGPNEELSVYPGVLSNSLDCFPVGG